MWRAVPLLTVVFIGLGLSGCSGAPVHLSSLISLSCADSVGQQGRNHETTVGGVEGLVLPGSGDLANLYAIRSDGKRYFVYKAFLAVSAAAAPYATVSIVRPGSARLVYGSSSRIGKLTSTNRGQALVAASRSRVRLPVCGPRFTGFVGGIIITRPTCVTFEVSSRSARKATVTVPIGAAKC